MGLVSRSSSFLEVKLQNKGYIETDLMLLGKYEAQEDWQFCPGLGPILFLLTSPKSGLVRCMEPRKSWAG